MARDRIEVPTAVEAAVATAPPPAAVAVAEERGRFYYGWWIVTAAFVAMFTTAGAQAYVAGAFFVPMSDDLGWTRAEYLYGQTVGQFFMAFAGFFIGAYVDRLGARPVMLVGATLLAAALFAVSTVDELWQWVLIRGVFGMLGAALLGNLVVNVTLSKWFVERRARAIGFASIGVSMAGVVLPPLMTWFVDEFGWRAGWRFLAVGVIALGYPAALIMRRTPEDYGLHPDGMSSQQMASERGARTIADFANSFTRSEAIRTRTLYMLVTAFGLASLGMITMIVLTIPYLTDQGFARGTAALMVSVLAIPAAISKPVWGYMGDRGSERLSTALSFGMNAFAVLVIIAATKTESVPLLAVGYFIVGWGIGGQIPLQETIWATYFGRRHIGAVRSAAMPFTMLIAASGPLLFATYFDIFGNYDGAMLGVACAWSLGAVTILLTRSPVPPARLREPTA